MHKFLIISALFVSSLVYGYFPFIQITNPTTQNYLCVVVAHTSADELIIQDLPPFTKINHFEQTQDCVKFQLIIQVYSQSNVKIEPFLYNKATQQPVACTLDEIYFVNHIQKSTYKITPAPGKIFFTLSPNDDFGTVFKEEEPTFYMKLKDRIYNFLPFKK